jgi:hypothetical protein
LEASHPTTSHDTCNTDTEHKKNLQEQGIESLLKLTNEHEYFTGMQIPRNFVRLMSELSLNSAGIRTEPAANGDEVGLTIQQQGRLNRPPLLLLTGVYTFQASPVVEWLPPTTGNDLPYHFKEEDKQIRPLLYHGRNPKTLDF